ncbi:hypothetical protein DPSP01_002046 [Paraphaeosphaeria sporulosa]
MDSQFNFIEWSQSPSRTPGGRRRSFIWTPEMVETLLQALVEQVESGQRADSGYKVAAWEMATKEVNLCPNCFDPTIPV